MCSNINVWCATAVIMLQTVFSAVLLSSTTNKLCPKLKNIAIFCCDFKFDSIKALTASFPDAKNYQCFMHVEKYAAGTVKGSGNDCYLVLPTGSGKTLFLFLSQQMKVCNFLYIITGILSLHRMGQADHSSKVEPKYEKKWEHS